jgi:hypothetical protein
LGITQIDQTGTEVIHLFGAGGHGDTFSDFGGWRRLRAAVPVPVGGVVASRFGYRYRANRGLAFLVSWSDQIYSSLFLGLQAFGHVV